MPWLIVLRGEDKYVLRWNPRQPLGAYIVVERWLREGIVDVIEFDALIGLITGARAYTDAA